MFYRKLIEQLDTYLNLILDFNIFFDHFVYFFKASSQPLSVLGRDMLNKYIMFPNSIKIIL